MKLKDKLCIAGAILGLIAILVSACLVGEAVSGAERPEPEAKAVIEDVAEVKEPVDTFTYYEIPKAYKEAGGNFPEDVQRYLLKLCEERDLDYPTLIALIERESKYKSNAVGDNGNSYGYGQIYKIWHKQRMADEGVQDLTEPYGNLRVCTSYLKYIKDRYGDKGNHFILMVYNMGEPVALRAWKNGVQSTQYSREILQRAEEIKQDLQDK
jgi:soluble lytic murein transglycosylase-like protein